MDIEEKKRRKNEYMKNYLRRYRQTDRGRQVQKAIKNRMNMKYRLEANLARLSEIAIRYVESLKDRKLVDDKVTATDSYVY